MSLGDSSSLANVANSLQSLYVTKLVSLPRNRYNWLTEEYFTEGMRSLRHHLGDQTRYEVRIQDRVPAGDQDQPVRGRVDAIDYNTVFELKWTDTLRTEHVLQLATYALLDTKGKPGRKYKLLHVPTGQLIEIKPLAEHKGKEKFLKVVQEVLKQKLRVRDNGLGFTDEQFVKELKQRFPGGDGERYVSEVFGYEAE
ncbi:hypothetical protein G7K_5857-t1 [Saitoella complicata NRRL Y-17804]|uniref:PD-(D/E)XK endonuclease-like domain-containing protein n=2 Tax=Saitoella complicata (strain BCRC 22490 / CBS 7301 / JCM 7358 / NBRC 10748 / NRRL Y-17804) TaxID=698492 RepID=A0A0E9NPK2_SAICN|nr:hypothetical protein G7K_5857-t1 [Saitoella complicata NRRL Y-17804]